MKQRSFIVLFLLFLLISMCYIVFGEKSINGQSEEMNVHEETSPMIFLINTKGSGLFLITAKLNKQHDKVEIEYTCDFNTNNEVKFAEVGVGIVKEDSKDISEIKSVKVKCDLLMGGKHSYKQSYPITSPLLNKDSTVIFWVKNITPLNKRFCPYTKKGIIDYLNAVEFEQIRLSDIAVYNKADDVISEVCRNQRE